MGQQRTRQLVMVAAEPADRDRVNQLARQLTEEGPGRFGQPEALRYLLDCYADMTRTQEET